MSEVRIRKIVDYKTLEAALLKAAKEVGWKSKVEDKFKRGYRLCSLEEFQDYRYTKVYLRGRVFPAMQVYIHNKKPAGTFFLFTGFPFGFASKRSIEKYLSAVSRNL